MFDKIVHFGKKAKSATYVQAAYVKRFSIFKYSVQNLLDKKMFTVVECEPITNSRSRRWTNIKTILIQCVVCDRPFIILLLLCGESLGTFFLPEYIKSYF